jgi:hypothetical protein
MNRSRVFRRGSTTDGHHNCADECQLSGVKRQLAHRPHVRPLRLPLPWSANDIGGCFLVKVRNE